MSGCPLLNNSGYLFDIRGRISFVFFYICLQPYRLDLFGGSGQWIGDSRRHGERSFRPLTGCWRKSISFYSHFETKDALLKAMCTDIFDHIFSHELHSETSHDFSASDHGLQEKITHLLYHLKDNQSNVLGVLSGDSGELFMRYFKEYLADMFEQYPESIRKDVPREFAINHLVGSFAEAVKWWIGQKMKMPPEEMAEYYLKLTAYRNI